LSGRFVDSVMSWRARRIRFADTARRITFDPAIESVNVVVMRAIGGAGWQEPWAGHHNGRWHLCGHGHFDMQAYSDYFLP
jgi:hypothetical protein